MDAILCTLMHIIPLEFAHHSRCWLAASADDHHDDPVTLPKPKAILPHHKDLWKLSHQRIRCEPGRVSTRPIPSELIRGGPAPLRPERVGRCLLNRLASRVDTHGLPTATLHATPPANGTRTSPYREWIDFASPTGPSIGCVQWSPRALLSDEPPIPPFVGLVRRPHDTHTTGQQTTETAREEGSSEMTWRRRDQCAQVSVGVQCRRRRRLVCEFSLRCRCCCWGQFRPGLVSPCRRLRPPSFLRLPCL